MSFPFRLAGVLTIAGALAACDSSGPASTGSQVQFNIATRAATAAAPAAGVMSSPVSFADSTDTLVIDQVQMVVRELELKRTDATSDSTCSHDGEDDGCEELESGPFLLDLPLSTGATTVLTVPVTPGTYSELEFKVHAPSNDSADAFLALHPDFAGVSIRVTGTWNGTPFTYETGVKAKQELEIRPPLVVTDSSNADFTLFIDVGTWFRGMDGKLLDPASANAGGANEELVNDNIVRSFHAFEDENHNGCDDNNEGGDQGGDGHHDGGGDSGGDDHGGM
jgi:hypothetical protein